MKGNLVNPTNTESTQSVMELGLQELEAIEAPGAATGAGAAVGVVLASLVGYGAYVGAAALIST
ncbi:hypothetical protein ACFQ71_23535 [Streptomyces sp. NPDC056534]|uniref:hypothetical protein n=1 Tax=Streptomyces sp. NPDC056534 TaxID=3345857 RepID=UPI0036C432E4